MVAVLEMTVPPAVPPFTATTSVMVSVPTAMLTFVQLTAPVPPTAGDVHDQPAGAETETNVVFVGVVSDMLAFAALLGPLLIALIVYVMFVPAVTGSGVSTFVTCTSAEVFTVVVSVSLLFAPFGSVVADDAVAVFDSTVPFASVESALTVSVKTALVTPRVAIEQLTVPMPPTAGVVQDQPPGDDSETNLVPVGRVSASAAVVALLGPALFTVMV
jgi:hypothetical protein